jgi:hypothetical protein
VAVVTTVQWSMALSEVANPDGALCCDPSAAATITGNRKLQNWLRDHAYESGGCRKGDDNDGYWLSKRDAYPDKLLCAAAGGRPWPETDPTFGQVVG